MLTFILYLIGSIILLCASIDSWVKTPTLTNLAFIIASVFFCAGGINGLATL